MTSALVFSNHTGKTIEELHGVIIFKAKPPVQFAKTIINFDREFMGTLENNEGILVHLHIPVKGLKEEQVFERLDLDCEFNDAGVVYADENSYEEETNA